MKRAQKNSSKTPQLQRPAAEENVNSVMLFSENLNKATSSSHKNP